MNECSNVYQDQVQICAQGFVGNRVLKSKVQEAASTIFDNLNCKLSEM